MDREHYHNAQLRAIEQNLLSTPEDPIYVKVVGSVPGIATGDYGYIWDLDDEETDKYIIVFNTDEKKEKLQHLQNDRIYRVIPKEFIEHKRVVWKMISTGERELAKENARDQAIAQQWISTPANPIYVRQWDGTIGYVVGQIEGTDKYKHISNHGVDKLPSEILKDIRVFEVIPNEHISLQVRY